MYDVVIALGGDPLRKTKAAQLYVEGQAKKLLFTGENLLTLPVLYGQYLGNSGATDLNCLIPTFQSLDTIQDFVTIKQTMERFGLTTALVVDSDYHIPRSKMIAGKILYPYYSYNFLAVSYSGPSMALTEAKLYVLNYLELLVGRDT